MKIEIIDNIAYKVAEDKNSCNKDPIGLPRRDQAFHRRSQLRGLLKIEMLPGTPKLRWVGGLLLFTKASMP